MAQQRVAAHSNYGPPPQLAVAGQLQSQAANSQYPHYQDHLRAQRALNGQHKMLQQQIPSVSGSLFREAPIPPTVQPIATANEAITRNGASATAPPPSSSNLSTMTPDQRLQFLTARQQQHWQQSQLVDQQQFRLQQEQRMEEYGRMYFQDIKQLLPDDKQQSAEQQPLRFQQNGQSNKAAAGTSTAPTAPTVPTVPSAPSASTASAAAPTTRLPSMYNTGSLRVARSARTASTTSGDGTAATANGLGAVRNAPQRLSITVPQGNAMTIRPMTPITFGSMTPTALSVPVMVTPTAAALGDLAFRSIPTMSPPPASSPPAPLALSWEKIPALQHRAVTAGAPTAQLVPFGAVPIGTVPANRVSANRVPAVSTNGVPTNAFSLNAAALNLQSAQSVAAQTLPSAAAAAAVFVPATQTVNAAPTQRPLIDRIRRNQTQRPLVTEEVTEGGHLPQRDFLTVSYPQFGDPSSIFRVVSFNVMPKNAVLRDRQCSQKSALSGFGTRPHYHSWQRRGPLLLREIERVRPDVVSLQGCDRFDYFQQHLSPKGFVGVFERAERPSMAKGLFLGDGVAIFWRTDRFKLSGRRRVVLGDERFVSSIAVMARLKRHFPFLKAGDTESLSDPLNIAHEAAVQWVDERGALQRRWMVLSTKWLYLFREEQQYHRPLCCLDLDGFRRINESSADLNDHSFRIVPLRNNADCGEHVFWTNDPSATAQWIEAIKSAQIGTEIDVWSGQLTVGHSLDAERLRIAQCQQLLRHIASATATPLLEAANIGPVGRAAATPPDDDRKEEGGDGRDLSEQFRKLMMRRIANKHDDDEKSGGGTAKSALPDDGQELSRPLVLCIDTASNALGDALNEVPPLCYAFLTAGSRTTAQHPLYQHSLSKLRAEWPREHRWFLQSAYALGFGEEPEITAFSRFWPLGDDSNDDFRCSIEMPRCSDLLLFSPQHFRVLALLENVKKEWVYGKWNRSLPNADYPSDHTLIAADLEMVWKNRGKAFKERLEREQAEHRRKTAEFEAAAQRAKQRHNGSFLLPPPSARYFSGAPTGALPQHQALPLQQGMQGMY